MNLPLSQIEGKYEILHKIKEGGMGAIYKVRHRLLEEVRVIKTIRPQLSEDADLRERFLREAKTAIRLRHPNIAQLYDFSVDADGTAYIVMEYIDGVTLQEMLAKSGPPPVPLILEMARQGLEALAYLHGQGFVHRDVAPDNLMLTRSFDGLPQIKLIDVGIAKRLEGWGAHLTGTGTFLGKIRYAAPEQFSDSGAAGVDPRSDVYSFGVMLYELLTGRLPFRGETVHELMAGHLFRPPLGFDETDPEGRVPEPLRQTVMHALAKEPGERIGSAEALGARLAPLLAPPDALREDLDQTLHATATLLVTREEAAEPGSTQDRLAEQFGLDATPRPESPRPVRGPRRIETRDQEIAALLANGQLFARLEQFDRAKHELDRLLELDPRSRDGLELRESVEAALAERKEAARRRAAAARKKAQAEEAEALGRADEERERAEDEAKRRSDAGKLLARARKAAAEDPGKAQGLLWKALELAPDHAEAQELLVRVVAAIREREMARAAAVAVQSISGRIADGDLDRAEQELSFARTTYGAHPELEQVAEQLARARAAADALRHREDEAAAGTTEEEPAAPASEPGRVGAPVEPDAVIVARRPMPRRAWVALGGLVLLLAVALIGYLASSPGEPPTPARGYLVLDALPWAEVTEIRDAGGEPVALDGPRHTPLRLALPPGTYTVSLENPSAPEPVAITVEIRAGESAERVVQITEVAAEEYLETLGPRRTP